MDEFIASSVWDAVAEPKPDLPHLTVAHDPGLGTIASVSVDGEIVETGADRG